MLNILENNIFFPSSVTLINVKKYFSVVMLKMLQKTLLCKCKYCMDIFIFYVKCYLHLSILFAYSEIILYLFLNSCFYTFVLFLLIKM